MSARTRALQAKQKAALDAAKAINAKVEAEGRDALNDDEAKAFDAHMAEAASLKAQIERQAALELAEAGMTASRGSSIDVPEGASLKVTENLANDPKRGFASIGEYLQAVKVGSQRNGAVDQRLTISAAAPSTFGGEGAGADGGFLVPPSFSSDIFTLALADDALLPMTDNTPVDGNGMVFPKDETTPWGTNGVRAYWQAEASAATATKPVLGTQAMRLHKLMGIVPLTNELLADTSAAGSFVMGLIARSVRWKTNEAILFGSGEGQPQGMFNSGAVVVQAKESGQATQTLLAMNIANMVARLPPGSYGDAQWFITPDLLPSLWTLNSNNQILYLPYGGGNGPFQSSPYGTLLGRPVNVSQHAPAFSAQGDLSLVVPNWYRTITKSGSPMQSDQSMHLYFDADVTAFRATFRMDGGSKIAAPIAQAKGSKTLSPFVQLQAR